MGRKTAFNEPVYFFIPNLQFFIKNIMIVKLISTGFTVFNY